jgi:type VI secretion system protein ImpL
LHPRPWYLLLGTSGSGKTGLLEGLARLVPPLDRPAAHLDQPTPDCSWWTFPTALILDTCGRYTSARPHTPDHEAWCGVLECLQHAQARRWFKGVLLTLAADTLGMQSPELVRRDALTAAQRVQEIRRVLGREMPLYILVTRCDLLEGFVEFVAHLPAYVHTQVFGCVHAMHPLPGRRHDTPATTLPGAQMTVMLTRRLEQLRLVLLNEVLRTGRSRQQIFCFPEEFRALQRRLGLFLEALWSPEMHCDPPWLRGLFFCSAQQRGMPVSILRHTLGFKTPVQPLEESPTSYFLRDFLTVILLRDRHLSRSAARTRRG